VSRWRYRRRARRLLRRVRRRRGGPAVALAAAAAIIVAVLAHAAGDRPAPATPGGGAAAAAAAIGYARAQLGAPYVYAGTGPYSAGFDCSGLVMMAYRAAGITLPRTSEEQWAAGPQVSTPQPGDLVFFAGSDGTRTSPGHVGLVTDPAAHLMIDAYATGSGVRYDTYGLPSSAPGLSDPVGFTAPASGGS
jgi:peptidoglycan DL-endopeptidase CwlO